MTPLKLMANSQGRPLSWQVLLFPCHQFLRGTVPASGLGDQLTQGVGLSVLFGNIKDQLGVVVGASTINQFEIG